MARCDIVIPGGQDRLATEPGSQGTTRACHTPRARSLNGALGDLRLSSPPGMQRGWGPLQSPGREDYYVLQAAANCLDDDNSSLQIPACQQHKLPKENPPKISPSPNADAKALSKAGSSDGKCTSGSIWALGLVVPQREHCCHPMPDRRVLWSEGVRERRRGGGCRGAVSLGHTAAITAGSHSRGGEGSNPLVLWVEKYQLGDLNDSTEATEESAQRRGEERNGTRASCLSFPPAGPTR